VKLRSPFTSRRAEKAPTEIRLTTGDAFPSRISLSKYTPAQEREAAKPAAHKTKTQNLFLTSASNWNLMPPF